MKAPFVPCTAADGAGPRHSHMTRLAGPGCSGDPEHTVTAATIPGDRAGTTPALCQAAVAFSHLNPFKQMIEEVPGQG